MGLLIYKIAMVLIFSMIAGYLYYLGGQDGHNTKVRDFGVPFVTIILLIWLGLNYSGWIILSLFLSFGAMFGAMTTYCTPKDQEDVHFMNWLLTGCMYGFTTILLAWATGNWMGFWIRTGFLTIMIPLWSEIFGDVRIEATGRGFWFTFSAPLLLL
jgi:hypothetical protein